MALIIKLQKKILAIILYCARPPSGGFYSDEVGYVGNSCKLCPTGSFVQFDQAPGTQSSHCKSCPLGKVEFLIQKHEFYP